MLFSRFAKIVGLKIVGPILLTSLAAAQGPLVHARPLEPTIVQDAPPADCHVTLPSSSNFVPPAPFLAEPEVNTGGLGKDQFWYGTTKLWTMLPVSGIWRGWQQPINAGDFAYSNKLPWYRSDPPKHGQVTIRGRRLDGPAPAFTETWALGMGGIHIPVYGCWQITGRYRDQELSFTVWVAPPTELSGAIHLLSHEGSAANVAPRRIFVDRETQSSSLVFQVTPEIPPEAKAAGISGSVLLHAVISTSGRPRQLQYVSGPPALTEAAIEAATWWQYRVAMVGDEGAEVDTTIEVVFQPERD